MLLNELFKLTKRIMSRFTILLSTMTFLNGLTYSIWEWLVTKTLKWVMSQVTILWLCLHVVLWLRCYCEYTYHQKSFHYLEFVNLSIKFNWIFLKSDYLELFADSSKNFDRFLSPVQSCVHNLLPNNGVETLCFTC